MKGASLMDRLGSIAVRAKRELDLYRRVAAHPRTPPVSRWLLVAAVAYAASPIDIVPDFIPVLGHLDDAVLVPCLAIVALKLIPLDVIAECREASNSPATRPRHAVAELARTGEE